MPKLAVAALLVAAAVFCIVGTVVCFGTRGGGRCSLAIGDRRLSIDFALGLVEYVDFSGTTFNTPYEPAGDSTPGVVSLQRKGFGRLRRFTFLECAGWAGLAVGIVYVVLAACLPRAKPDPS